MRKFLLYAIMLCFSVTQANAFLGIGETKTKPSIERAVPRNHQEVLLSYSPIVKQSAPAVVNIYTKRKVKVRSVSPFFKDPFFQQFLGRFKGRGPEKERVESSLGSGVIVSAEGFVVTSNHVIQGSQEIRIVLSDRREFDAEIVIADPKTDLALLKINGGKRDFPYLTLMNSDDLEVGDLALAIGNPFGVGQTVTSGIISGLARNAQGVSDYQFFIQTDAAINPGNSGGALVTMNGMLVGINTAIYTKSGGSNGIGFAIPANMVATLLRSQKTGGKIIRPWLGVTTQAFTQDIADSLGIEIPQGALIQALHPESPVKKAGVKVGDVIIALNGKKIRDENEMQFRIATYPLDSDAEFTVWRNGKAQNIDVKMIAPPETTPKDERHLKGTHPFNGAIVANLSPLVASQLSISATMQGVIVMGLKQASRFGLKPKDIVKKVNGVDISSTKQLAETLKKKASKWTIIIQRGGQLITYTIKGF